MSTISALETPLGRPSQSRAGDLNTKWGIEDTICTWLLVIDVYMIFGRISLAIPSDEVNILGTLCV